MSTCARSISARFLAAGALLYDGPWLAERHAAVGRFIEQHPDDVHPITRSIILGARRFNAADAFAAEYRRRELAIDGRRRRGVDVDAIVVPSVPTDPDAREVAADPIGVNARLGQFSTFVNLLDLCAVAVPGGMLASGFPVGFTLIAPALLGPVPARRSPTSTNGWSTDRSVRSTSRSMPPATSPAWRPRSATTVPLAVVGAHLSGQPLNDQLVSRGATARRTDRRRPRATDSSRSPNTAPPKPGLFRVSGADRKAARRSRSRCGTFRSRSSGRSWPACLRHSRSARWNSRTDRGSAASCANRAAWSGAEDITHHGGWRAYLARRG